jgi:alpha-tubulin suppressor-like RCC1 family protein
VQVGALTNWSTLPKSQSYQGSLAIKTDGTLWAWGHNYYGRLGLGDTTDRSSPTQVGSLTTWYDVARGNNQTFALKT